MAYIIAQPCTDVKDKSCMQECPVDCIYEGGRQLYIHPEECVDCGACEPVCPVEAIFYEEDVPDDWRPYRAANAEFFDTLGSPGGAAALGPLDFDHPVAVAAESSAASSSTVSANTVSPDTAATGAA
ncbi:MAG TPA: ferredoxin [Actinocrinis sp.]|nr:ferredoxin [Actinocrinis sp.]